tara:strand:+ start:6698 stop:7072 length:375 start_codon:yes stop_codon:yes gene_type:complete
MVNYKVFIIGFIIQALIFATISTLSIETRFGISSTKQKPIAYQDNFFKNLYKQFFYKLKTIPYDISSKLNILTDAGDVPEYVKLIYVFIISFLISILVYHLFLLLLGYKFIYKYFFGNIKIKSK